MQCIISLYSFLIQKNANSIFETYSIVFFFVDPVFSSSHSNNINIFSLFFAAALLN